MTKDPTINPVSDDTKQVIARVIALQSLATDPGQKLQLTSAVLNWVATGLAIKYGETSVPPRRVSEIVDGRNLYFEAITDYMRGEEFWGKAMMKVHDVTTIMTAVAATEQILDYKVFDFNFTQQGLLLVHSDVAPEGDQPTSLPSGSGSARVQRFGGRS